MTERPAGAQMLYNALLENNCSEQASRMAAMESSTKNASEMLAKLTLTYNRCAACPTAMRSWAWHLVCGCPALSPEVATSPRLVRRSFKPLLFCGAKQPPCAVQDAASGHHDGAHRDHLRRGGAGGLACLRVCPEPRRAAVGSPCEGGYELYGDGSEALSKGLTETCKQTLDRLQMHEPAMPSPQHLATWVNGGRGGKQSRSYKQPTAL